MFKRRNARSYPQIAQEIVYPRGGWRRAGQYMLHRLRRLPDPPHRIGRGVAAGVFASFTPILGGHVAFAMLLSWAIRGNILASLIGTLAGNPLTLPFIAVGSVGLGRAILGEPMQIAPQTIIGELGRAAGEFANNLLAIVTDREAHWSHFSAVWDGILLPYLIGGILLGAAAGIVAHYLTVPLIVAYQRRRAEARLARQKVRVDQADGPKA